MSEANRLEFYAKVKAAQDAITEYAEGRERYDWFVRGLDDKLRDAVNELLDSGVRTKVDPPGVGKLRDRYPPLGIS